MPSKKKLKILDAKHTYHYFTLTNIRILCLEYIIQITDECRHFGLIYFSRTAMWNAEAFTFRKKKVSATRGRSVAHVLL